MITSRSNSQLKDIRRLRKCKDDHALLEGPHLITEALTSGLELTRILATPEFLEGAIARKLLPNLPLRPLEVLPRLLDELTDSDSPRGVIATARLSRTGASRLPIVPEGVYIYTEGLQDPGNLGALARAAEASGTAGLCLGPACAHPNHPRALRASAGSLLRLPTAVRSAPDELDQRLASIHPRWLALVPRGGTSLFGTSFEGAVVIALGGEAAGLSQQLIEHADLQVTIPLAQPVESLNATVAAAITAFEIRRQRCLGSKTT